MEKETSPLGNTTSQMEKETSPYGAEATELLNKLMKLRQETEVLFAEGERVCKHITNSGDQKKFTEGMDNAHDGLRRMRMALRGRGRL